jgi:hypothetical protein
MAKKTKNRSRAQQAQARAKAASQRAQSAPRGTTTNRSTSTAKRPASGPANRARRLRPTDGGVRGGIRRGLSRPLLIGVVAVVLFGGFYAYQWWQSKRPAAPPTFEPPTVNVEQNPNLAGLRTGPPPWDAALATLRERLGQLHLPVLASEVVEQHFHVHLDVFVDGKSVTLPDDVGRNEGGGYLTVIHTHDSSGIVHIEAPKGPTYNLGQVFDVWGVRFTPTCLGASCNAGDRRLRVYVGGTLLHVDPRRLILSSHQEIVVTFGTQAQVPNPVPSKYGFPLGA